LAALTLDVAVVVVLAAQVTVLGLAVTSHAASAACGIESVSAVEAIKTARAVKMRLKLNIATA
jgi:hypothetical protein